MTLGKEKKKLFDYSEGGTLERFQKRRLYQTTGIHFTKITLASRSYYPGGSATPLHTIFSQLFFNDDHADESDFVVVVVSRE
jgi:hypothetical protein